MGHRNPMAMLNNQRVVGAHQIHRFQIGGFVFQAERSPWKSQSTAPSQCEQPGIPQHIGYSYGHLSVISTYNPIYRMYNPICIQL